MSAKKEARNYVATHPDFKGLHIGCQHHPKENWLNVDIFPKDRNVVYMDATKPYPLKKNTFNCVFSEHMIEYISYEDGEKMLKEAFAILKPGGTIRISMPNLEFLMALGNDDNRAVKDRYIKSFNKFYPTATDVNTCMVVNNFVRNWGHLFIYDEETLAQSLRKAGFSNVRKCIVGECKIPTLNKIENHGKEIGDDFNLLESMVFEGDKVI